MTPRARVRARSYVLRVVTPRGGVALPVLHVTFMRDVGALRHYTLEALSLRAAQFGSALGPALRTAELPSLTSLRIDLLDAENFSDMFQWSWRPMFETAFPALRHLAITNAYLGDHFVDDLAASSSVILPTLEQLDLSRTKLTARGAARLVADRLRFAHLDQLRLDGNPLDDDALAALRDAYGDALRFTPAPPPDADHD